MTSYIKKYLPINFLLLGIFLCLCACTDDNFITTELETETTYPDTSSYVFIRGTVSDNYGNNLAGVTVDYIEDGTITSIMTDENGFYEVRNTDLSETKKMIRCHAEGYLPKMDIIFTPSGNVIEKNIILAAEEDFTGGPGENIAEQSFSDSLVSVTGRLVDENGNGVAGLAVLIVEVSDFTFYYGISDANGDWSIAIDPIASAVVGVYSDCESFEALIPDQDFLEDADLGDLTTTLVKPEVVNFSGFITDCNTGEGLVLGSIQISFQDEARIETADIINGVYNLNIEKCSASSCVDITIYSILNTPGVDEFLCEDYTLGTTELDYEVCNEIVDPGENDGYINSTLNGVLTVYSDAIVEEDLGSYKLSAYYEPDNLGLYFETPTNPGTSGFFLTGAVLNLNNFTAIYTANFDQIEYQIDSITTEYMYGSYIGEMKEGINGPIVPVEGEFKAKIQ